jgi:CheY-like chemotaxis protein
MSQRGPTQANPKTILLAGEEDHLRHELAQCLRFARFEVVEARNGEEAVARLTAGTAPFLLITDVDMSGAVDGTRLARFARVWKPGIKILFMSGRLDMVELLGVADASFAKPVDPGQLMAVVQYLADTTCDNSRELQRSAVNRPTSDTSIGTEN